MPQPTPIPEPRPTQEPQPPDQALACAAADADATAGTENVSSPTNSCPPGSGPTSPQTPTPATLMAHIAVHVQDSSGKPIPGVTVAVEGMCWDGVTDDLGNFDFGDVSPNTYAVTGTKDCFTPTTASQTKNAPSGTSTLYQLVLTLVQVEIQINNTPTTSDDLVGLQCDHPAHRSKVDCRIRATGATAILTIVLTNPDGRLRFPESADTTKTVSVPSDGSWVPFQISGEKGSNAIGDAVIEAHCQTEKGALLGTKPVTVFWFDKAQIKLTQAGNYKIIGLRYTAPGDISILFAAQATIKPSKIDCTSPQVKDLRIGIMQEVTDMEVTFNYDTPTLAPGTPPGTSVTVPAKIALSVSYDPTLHMPINDGGSPTQEPPSGAYPLYSKRALALTPPIGCTNGSAATSSDDPGFTFPPTYVNGDLGVTVIWKQFVNATAKNNFRTFCVVFNTVTEEYCALRQASWSLNTDSAAAADQHVAVNRDGPVTADPATGVQGNAAKTIGHIIIEAKMVTLTQP